MQSLISQNNNILSLRQNIKCFILFFNLHMCKKRQRKCERCVKELFSTHAYKFKHLYTSVLRNDYRNLPKRPLKLQKSKLH